MKYNHLFITLILLICDQLKAQETSSDDVFKSEFYGFEITKPSHWYFYLSEGQPELSSNIKLKDEYFR